MVKKTAVKLLGAGAVVLGVALMVGTAWATNMFGPANTCTTVNCNARLIQGTVTNFGPSAQPWVAEVFAPNGRCFRLAVTAETTDLEMVVRAPNGQVFRNDDGGGACPLCPVVKIGNTPNNGWYTVSIGHFAGTALSSNFSMVYSTYPVGNPNCALPTAPFSTQDDAVKSQKAPAVEQQLQPQEGEPGN